MSLSTGSSWPHWSPRQARSLPDRHVLSEPRYFTPIAGNLSCPHVIPLKGLPGGAARPGGDKDVSLRCRSSVGAGFASLVQAEAHVLSV